MFLPRPGNVFNGRYVLLETIGRGGMATVFRGFDVPHKRQVALKVLNLKFSAEEKAVGQFFTEARMARRLRHPGIVTIHDFGRTDVGYLFIAMELLDGEPLSRLLHREGPLAPARALRMTLQILDGLSAAHRYGTIHRDLKPDNVFVMQRGDGEQLKLIDFGISQFAGAVAGTKGEISGTPAYMSPEQIRGHKARPESDLYSLGVLLFEMLTGKPPFPGTVPKDVMKAHLKEEPPLPRSINPALVNHADLEELVMQLLQKSPDMRPESAEGLRDDVAHLAEPLGVLVPKVLGTYCQTPTPLPVEMGNQSVVVSYSHKATSPANTILPIKVLHAGAAGMEEFLDKQVRPGIWLEEGLPLASASADSAPESERPGLMTTPVDGTSLRRLTMLHARFVVLGDGPTVQADVEALRQQVNDSLDAWFSMATELGGLVCHDSGTELRILFGYQELEHLPEVSALECAVALQSRLQEVAWGEGIPLAACVGIASGGVYADRSSASTPEWLVRGSEIDVAVRLSRFCPVGGVMMCPHTVTGARNRVEVHHVAKLAARGGKRIPIHLLKAIRAPKTVDVSAPMVRPRSAPIEVPALLHE